MLVFCNFPPAVVVGSRQSSLAGQFRGSSPAYQDGLNRPEVVAHLYFTVPPLWNLNRRHQHPGWLVSTPPEKMKNYIMEMWKQKRKWVLLFYPSHLKISLYQPIKLCLIARAFEYPPLRGSRDDSEAGHRILGWATWTTLTSLMSKCSSHVQASSGSLGEESTVRWSVHSSVKRFLELRNLLILLPFLPIPFLSSAVNTTLFLLPGLSFVYAFKQHARN